MSHTLLSETRTYSVDPAHSAVRFWVRHMMIAKVHGQFSSISGSVVGSLEDPQNAKVEIDVAVSSLSTGQEQRDAHLKSGDFFDIENYPTMHFVSTSIRPSEDGFVIVGDLTMHGVTRSVELSAEVSPESKNPFGEGFKVAVSATGVINREDFGMGWNQALEAGGVLVGKEIHLTIDVELDRAA